MKSFLMKVFHLFSWWSLCEISFFLKKKIEWWSLFWSFGFTVSTGMRACIPRTPCHSKRWPCTFAAPTPSTSPECAGSRCPPRTAYASSTESRPVGAAAQTGTSKGGRFSRHPPAARHPPWRKPSETFAWGPSAHPHVALVVWRFSWGWTAGRGGNCRINSRGGTLRHDTWPETWDSPDTPVRKTKKNEEKRRKTKKNEKKEEKRRRKKKKKKGLTIGMLFFPQQIKSSGVFSTFECHGFEVMYPVR